MSPQVRKSDGWTCKKNSFSIVNAISQIREYEKDCMFRKSFHTLYHKKLKINPLTLT